LVAEMQQEWIEPVPQRILVTAKAALESFRGGRIDRELDALADSMAAAHEARDLDAARTLRDRWRELVDEKGSFAVNDSRLAAALPAVEWVDAHARMATVSEEVWNSLDARPGGLRMRQEWIRSLERLGNEMEDLAEKLEGEADGEAIERAHDRIGRQRAQLDRDIRFRRMMMYVGIASSAIVLGLSVWYFDDRARHDKSVETAVRELSAAQEKIAAGVLQELPDFERTWSARIVGNAEVGSLLAMVRGELDQQNGRRVRLAAALEKAQGGLHAAEEADRPDPLGPWPPTLAEATRSLAEVDESKLAATDQERADVTRVRSALDRLGKKLVGEADAACRERISAFDADLDKARDLVATDGTAAVELLNTVKLAVVSLREKAAAPAATDASASYATLRIASEPIIALLSPAGSLMRKAESIDGMLTSRRKFREALKDLDQRLGDWKNYSQQLEMIARDFAEFPEARDYALAAESKAQWHAVEAWRSYQPWLQQLHLATPERVRETLAKFEALSPDTKSLPMVQRIVQELLPAIKQLGERDMTKLRADLESWFSGTWLGELKFVVKTNEGPASYYCLDGQQQGASKFTYVTGRKDPAVGWPTKEERKTADTVELSPQSRLAENLRAAVRKAAPKGGVAVDQLFVTLLETVIAAKDTDALPRLVTARKLLLLAAEYSRPCREAGRPLEALIDDGQGSIPGVSINQIWSFVPPTRDLDAEYQVTKQRSTVVLAEIESGLPGIKEAIEKERQLLVAPPVSLAILAGRLGRDDAGDLVAVWRGSAPPRGPVWWFPAGADATVAGTVDEEGIFHPNASTGPAGTPLFTMTTGAKTGKKTEQQATTGGAR
jgi:hypothetical protein